MRVWEFEQTIYDLEEVRLVVRAAPTDEVEDYAYERCTSGGASVTDWLKQRVQGRVHPHHVVVIDGNGAVPHGRTLMSTVRATYER